MASHTWRSIPLLLLVLLFPSAAPLAQADEPSDLKAELEEIRRGLEEMKAAYEARIEALERKMAEQENLKVKLDERDKEIQELKAKVAELEKEGGGEDLAARVEELEQAEAPRHKAAPVGAYGGLMNPDISVVADIKGLVSSDSSNPLNKKIAVGHAELAIQGYLWPGIRGDVIAALEQEVTEDGDFNTEVDLEEAYASFLDLPASFQLQVGRKFQDFGRLNPLHPHHWPIPDTPLPLQRLFGHHPWYDDGLQASTLIPNPWDAYVKIQGGVWNGRGLGHGHEHEHEDEHHGEGFEGPVNWQGHVFTARTSLDFPLSEHTNLMPGYSFAGDEYGRNFLHGADLTLIHRWPQTYRKLRWQNEFFFGDFVLTGGEGKHDADAWGGYSLLQLTLNKYWETGTHFDWWDGNDLDDEWGTTAFLSYFFTHSMYVRPAYRYSDVRGGDNEHQGIVQFVFGLGPHAHRLED